MAHKTSTATIFAKKKGSTRGIETEFERMAVEGFEYKPTVEMGAGISSDELRLGCFGSTLQASPGRQESQALSKDSPTDRVPEGD